MRRPSPRALGRMATAFASAVFGIAAALAVLVFFNARDDATFSNPPSGPGEPVPDRGAEHISPGERGDVRYDTDPPASGPHVPSPVRRDRRELTDDQLLHALEAGDVVVLYPDERAPRALVRLQEDVSGPFDPTLAQLGQQLILARDPETRGIVALAWARFLRVPGPRDPRLRAFANAWLGRGAHD